MKMKKGNAGLVVLIITLFIVVIALCGFVLYNETDLFKDKGKTNDTDVDVYKSYKVGDSITLSDGSKWVVLKDSASTQDYVTILGYEKDYVEYLNSDEYSSVHEHLLTNKQEYKNSALDKFMNSQTLRVTANLKEVDGYKIRLITLDEIFALDNNWEYDKTHGSYVHNEKAENKYLPIGILTMTKFDPTSVEEPGKTWAYYNTGKSQCYELQTDCPNKYFITHYNFGVGGLYPVVNVYKDSIIDNGNINNDEQNETTPNDSNLGGNENNSILKRISYTEINNSGKYQLPETLENYYGLQIIFENNQFYFRLEKDSVLAETYTDVKVNSRISIGGIEATSVAKTFVAKIGLDVRMPKLLFLMTNGEVYYANPYEILKGTTDKAIKLQDVNNISDIVVISKAGNPGTLMLALTKNGDDYEIYGNGSTEKISIDKVQTLNVNLFKILNNKGTYFVEINDYYGLNVEYRDNKFYLFVSKNSDLIEEYLDIKVEQYVEIKGIDSLKVAKIHIKHTGSDVRMPTILFLMEDGTVYEINTYQALAKANNIATKVTGANDIVDILNVYNDGMPGLRSIGIKKDNIIYEF